MANELIEIYQGDSTDTFTMKVEGYSPNDYEDFVVKVMVLDKLGGSVLLGDSPEILFPYTYNSGINGVPVFLTPAQTNTLPVANKHLLVFQLYKNDDGTTVGVDGEAGNTVTSDDDDSSNTAIFRREIHFDLKVKQQAIGS